MGEGVAGHGGQGVLPGPVGEQVPYRGAGGDDPAQAGILDGPAQREMPAEAQGQHERPGHVGGVGQRVKDRREYPPALRRVPQGVLAHAGQLGDDRGQAQLGRGEQDGHPLFLDADDTAGNDQ